MKLYLAQTFYSHHGKHFGSIHLNKYSAADSIIDYLSAGMEEDKLPSEDQILAMKNSCRIYHGKDISVIATGEIDRIDFSIIEIELGDRINFQI